jgi:hypothetical protein
VHGEEKAAKGWKLPISSAPQFKTFDGLEGTPASRRSFVQSRPKRSVDYSPAASRASAANILYWGEIAGRAVTNISPPKPVRHIFSTILKSCSSRHLLPYHNSHVGEASCCEF